MLLKVVAEPNFVKPLPYPTTFRLYIKSFEWQVCNILVADISY